MTAPVFHRLSAPSYFGGLPATYDYLNNLVSGTPAAADGQKSGGPNSGTYFIAFGEDATSNDANRPNLALGTNTDYLDSLLHQDLVQVIRTGDQTVSGSPLATITLTGTNTIWLGTGGYAIKDLFHIVDQNDRDIEVSGTKVVVASISGGAVGGGFASSNVVLTLNVSIPVGVTYHAYFCQRTNLASIPIDAMTLPFMRNQDSVDGSVVDFIAQVSNPHTLGNAVAGIQSYRFQGPDGVRLAKNASMYFDCDPADSGASVRSHVWTTRQASVNRLVAALFDDPTSTMVAGLTGLLQTDVGVGFSSLGTFFLQDANMVTGVGPGMTSAWPVTSSSAGQGDLFPRLFELPVSSAALGSIFAPSLLRYTNGRWCCTVGDGTRSFGDFTGTNAINAAVAYATAVSIVNLHIQVKRGTYSVASTMALTGQVIIEGEQANETILQCTGATTGIFNLTAGSLWLKSLSLAFVSGTQLGVVTAAGTSLFMDDVQVGDIGLQIVSPTPFNGPASVRFRNCSFTPATAGVIAVDLQFTTNSNHSGFFFDDCLWTCSDETRPVRMLGSASIVTTVRQVRFRGCTYTLGGTATTSSHLTHNTGVLEINPNGGNDNLTVQDILWENCFPTSSTTLTNAPLLRLSGIGLGDNSTSHLAIIGTVTIRGGIWTANQAGTGTAISPFLIAATVITVDGTVFYGNAQTSGGQSSEDQYIVDGLTHGAGDWAQFIFAPGAQSVSMTSATTSDNRLNMSKVSFRGFNQASNSGDLWLYLGTSVDISGVLLTDYAVGGGTGSSPNSRIRISGNAATGAIRNITIAGASAASGSWTNMSTLGAGGLVLLMPTTYPSGNDTSLVIEGLSLVGFIPDGGSFDDGIVLPNPTAGFVGTGWQYSLIDCTASHCNRGLALYGSTGGSFPGQGGNTIVLSNFNIIRGTYNSCNVDGILLWPDYFNHVNLEGARASGNGNWGVSMDPVSWIPTGDGQVIVVNNHLSFNTNGGFVAFCHTSGQSPHVVYKGNSCWASAGVPGNVRFQVGISAAIDATSTPGTGGLFIYGAETGIAGSGAVMNYANGSPMVENIGLLQTP